MKAIKILSILLIVTSFIQCKSIKFIKNPPFKITNATYENWTGGVPGVSGTNVKIYYSSDTEIKFHQIYYANKIVTLEVKKTLDSKVLVGYFNTSTNKKELILHSNSTKEIKNSLPEIKEFPFQLKENQAVISYYVGKKINYFKIKNLLKQNGETYPKIK